MLTTWHRPAKTRNNFFFFFESNDVHSIAKENIHRRRTEQGEPKANLTGEYLEYLENQTHTLFKSNLRESTPRGPGINQK